MSTATLSNNSLGILYTERRIFHIDPFVVKELWNDATPFLAIVANQEIRQVPDPDFKMFEHRAGWVKEQCSVNNGAGYSWAVDGAAGDSIADVAVDGIVGLSSSVDNSWLQLEFEIWDSTFTTYKGTAVVTAVGSGTVTLKSTGNSRLSTNKAAALADNDVLSVIGTGFGEETEAPEGFTDDLEVVWNSAQIFKTAVSISGTLAAAALRGYSNELERFRMDKAKYHKIRKNRTFLLGNRPGGTNMDSIDGTSLTDSHSTVLTDAAGKNMRLTMGIIPTIYRYGSSDTTNDKQNIFTIDAQTYKYSNFVDDMEKIFQYLPPDGTLKAVCGPSAMSYWSKVDAEAGFAKKSGFAVQIDSMSRSELGFNFRRLITPHGILELIYDPGMRGPYANSMLIVDPSNLFLAQYRPEAFMANVKTDNAYDGVKDLWFSDEGVGITLIERHAIMNIVNN